MSGFCAAVLDSGTDLGLLLQIKSVDFLNFTFLVRNLEKPRATDTFHTTPYQSEKKDLLVRTECSLCFGSILRDGHRALSGDGRRCTQLLDKLVCPTSAPAVYTISGSTAVDLL